MWSGKSLQLLCILPFGVLCLSAIRMVFLKIILEMCLFVGVVFSVKCVQSDFL